MFRLFPRFVPCPQWRCCSRSYRPRRTGTRTAPSRWRTSWTSANTFRTSWTSDGLFKTRSGNLGSQGHLGTLTNFRKTHSGLSWRRGYPEPPQKYVHNFVDVRNILNLGKNNNSTFTTFWTSGTYLTSAKIRSGLSGHHGCLAPQTDLKKQSSRLPGSEGQFGPQMEFSKNTLAAGHFGHLADLAKNTYKIF